MPFYGCAREIMVQKDTNSIMQMDHANTPGRRTKTVTWIVLMLYTNISVCFCVQIPYPGGLG